MAAAFALSADAYVNLCTACSGCPLSDSAKISQVGAASTMQYLNWHDKLPPTLE